MKEKVVSSLYKKDKGYSSGGKFLCRMEMEMKEQLTFGIYFRT